LIIRNAGPKGRRSFLRSDFRRICPFPQRSVFCAGWRSDSGNGRCSQTAVGSGRPREARRCEDHSLLPQLATAAVSPYGVRQERARRYFTGGSTQLSRTHEGARRNIRERRS
jgi:hypothetical protein